MACQAYKNLDLLCPTFHTFGRRQKKAISEDRANTLWAVLSQTWGESSEAPLWIPQLFVFSMHLPKIKLVK